MYPKEATRSLSSMLANRAPKDPPPPRRGKRKNDNEKSPNNEGKQQKKAKTEASQGRKVSAEVESFTEDPAAISAAATQTSVSKTEDVINSKAADENSPSKDAGEGKTKKKRELTVGGWVSPQFGPTIDRAWLDKDSAQSKFQLRTFVPQPGDTVLYYIEGHRNFLKKHPDHP